MNHLNHTVKSLLKEAGCSPPGGRRRRDTTNPSGAASIEWFDQWIKTGDPAIKQRILTYNEDDVVATRVLLDGIRGLTTR
jgi:predicted RecB family nuclease